MDRILPPLFLLPLAFACSGQKDATHPHVLSSQETYEYGTCPKGGDDCPHERALACALQTIVSRYNACSKHEDCLASKLDAKCSNAGSCPPLYVNREMKSAFEAEAQTEVDRYCENATCKSSGLCFITKFEPRCVDLRCTWRQAIRGGPFEYGPFSAVEQLLKLGGLGNSGL
jgi:hypothetical protein